MMIIHQTLFAKTNGRKNYISNFDCSLWQIDDWGLYTAKSPIYINSLGSDFNVWFDVDGESFPTDKQLVAWAGFAILIQMK